MTQAHSTLMLTGVNYKTAPIELREKIAIGREELPETTRALAAMPGVLECMIVSTCNRVELLAAVDGPDTDLAAFLHRHFGLDPELLGPHIYERRDRDAVRHLFRVAASLDSMVVGEPQILGQVKEAFAVARASGTVAGQLEHLLQSAFAAAKKVRSETEIGSNSVSIASVAVDLARKIFGSLEGRTVFLVGAGKMSELAARHLMQHGADSMMVANRTYERAVQLAEQFLGEAIRFEELHARAHEADIIITSTGSAGQILGVQIGYSLANVFDPQTQADTPVLSEFHRMAALLIFLQLDVHHWLLRSLVRSFVYLPPGGALATLALAGGLLHAAGGIFLAGVQIAAPSLVATLIADMALGFLGKASPQLPVLFIGLAVKNLVGLTVLLVAMAYWPRMFSQQFANAIRLGERLLHLAR